MPSLKRTTEWSSIFILYFLNDIQSSSFFLIFEHQKITCSLYYKINQDCHCMFILRAIWPMLILLLWMWGERVSVVWKILNRKLLYFRQYHVHIYFTDLMHQNNWQSVSNQKALKPQACTVLCFLITVWAVLHGPQSECGLNVETVLHSNKEQVVTHP